MSGTLLFHDAFGWKGQFRGLSNGEAINGEQRRQKSTHRSRATTKARKRTVRKRSARKWSSKVTERSDALDLKKGVFTQKDPKKIAASLKRSAERSERRKAKPYQSAMSMLTFYINRGGKDLPASQKRKLQRAKTELRQLFGRD
jgi:hypothetical protein